MEITEDVSQLETLAAIIRAAPMSDISGPGRSRLTASMKPASDAKRHGPQFDSTTAAALARSLAARGDPAVKQEPPSDRDTAPSSLPQTQPAPLDDGTTTAGELPVTESKSSGGPELSERNRLRCMVLQRT